VTNYVDDEGRRHVQGVLDLRPLREDAGHWRDRAGRVAKKFLDGKPDSYPLHLLLVSYRLQVDEFYKWFGRRETELQSARLAAHGNPFEDG
jgi:hypothetical protein